MAKPVAAILPRAAVRDILLRDTIAHAPPLADRARGFSVRERIELLAWPTLTAGVVGRMQLHAAEPGDPPETGDFVLLYRPGRTWAEWALAPCGEAIELWRMADGRTLGRFPAMAAALVAIATV